MRPPLTSLLGDGRWSLFASRAWDPVDGHRDGVRVSVDGARIVSFESGASRREEDLFLDGHVLVPGFANGHDHLKYHWPSRLGGEEFSSTYDWIPFLQDRAHKSFLAEVDVDDLYWLGVYANMFSGASTTINHARMPSVVDPASLPIRLPTNFRRELMVDAKRNSVVWEHRMGSGAIAESLAALSDGVPFVVHIAEGVGVESAGEVQLLHDAGALHSGCVLVHAINLTESEIELIAAAGASVVWCPSSNSYLFGTTTPVRALLEGGINVLLGTDSPCSGSGFLRDEMILARMLLETQADFSSESASEATLRMVTTSFDKAFPGNRVGRLHPGSSADLALFPTRPDSSVFDAATKGPPSFLTCGGRAMVLPREWYANGCCARWEFDTTALPTGDRETVVAGLPNELLGRVTLIAGEPASYFRLGGEIEAHFNSNSPVDCGHVRLDSDPVDSA